MELNFEIRKCKSSNLFFFKIVLATLGALHFHMNIKISLSVSARKSSWDFDGCFELVDQF